MDSSTSSSSSSSSSSTETSPLHWLNIPKKYKVLKVMGEGVYGTVVKCVNRFTGRVVALKIPKPYYDLQHEVVMLNVLMAHNLDKFNVIKSYGGLFVQNRMSLLFEMLDISLYDYVVDLDGPMRLEDIRTVIQQMATAFEALGKIGVIHADVKLDNIMLVDHMKKPFNVKLIDFGLAIFRSQARQGCILQPLFYRAPEIILGLPFSEAIDIWSLGCVMATMMFGFMLFPARLDYDALKFISDLLGPPPQHVIDAAMRSSLFFKKNDSDQWVLKTPEEYWGGSSYSSDDRFYTFRSLDEEKTTRLERNNPRQPEERRECIELLKAMLTWDGEKRITPTGILNHPFITKSYLSSSSHLSTCSDESEPCCSSSQTTTRTRTRTKTKKMTKVDDNKREALPTSVIVVQPAPPQNRIHLEDTETTDEDSEISPHAAAAARPTLDATRIRRDNAELPPTSPDDCMDLKKKKRTKNILKRFYSWMKKRTLGFCCYVDVLE